MLHFGFGRSKAEGFADYPSRYGFTIYLNNWGFCIGTESTNKAHLISTNIVFHLMIAYPIKGWYQEEKQSLDIVYFKGTKWMIDIPYLDLSLDEWDCRAIFKAVNKKLKGEIPPDGLRIVPDNIYIDNTDESTKST